MSSTKPSIRTWKESGQYLYVLNKTLHKDMKGIRSVLVCPQQNPLQRHEGNQVSACTSCTRTSKELGQYLYNLNKALYKDIKGIGSVLVKPQQSPLQGHEGNQVSACMSSTKPFTRTRRESGQYLYILNKALYKDKKGIGSVFVHLQQSTLQVNHY